MSERKVDIITDLDGNKIVFIHDTYFKGKKKVNWNDVEEYLKRYIGEVYKIEDTDDLIYIGTDLPDEYAHSNYTQNLKGANAKAKGNAVTGIPELIEIATNKRYMDNIKEKHSANARYGWYKYDSRVGLPIYNDCGEVERYNVFHIVILVRHDKNGKMYLYDVMNIKKRNEQSFPVIRPY